MIRATRFLALAGTLAFLAAVALTIVDISLRSLTTGTVHGAVDLGQLCVMIGAMLAIPYGFATDQHVAIDLFTEKLPVRIQVALRIFAALLGAVFLAGVFWFSLQQALIEISGGDRSQTIGIPMSWYWAPFLIGIGLSVVSLLVVALDLMRNGLPSTRVEEAVH
ncbi:TRAP transporter small permease [Bosea sp. (in: a-proteobacteria)]|jgi:TRAP-type C4-dicarboxylate transport system permease small subunit|uniref:TRAP transporter small permease n=1 Tax=Bosea sp. (in: a-proteobacteria) TaxID=1871050 RepID=UPI003F6FB569